MQKILLIEDSTEIRENMAEILELAGYEVHTAAEGKEGMTKAIEVPPDLILCDIMMPVLDGYGVLHMLQMNQELQNTPFIFLTAKSERAEIRKGMELGADDYITKPFDGTELLNAVARRLQKAEDLKRRMPASMDSIRELMDLSQQPDLLAEFKEGRNTNHYKKRQLIYSEGNHPTKMFYIVKGKVKAYKRNVDGKEFIIGLYKEGDFLGYMPLLEGRPYMETAEALDDTELALIPKDAFDNLLSESPGVMKKFISILADNIHQKEEQLLAIAYDSLRQKVADTLVTFYRKYNSVNDPAFYLDLSRENLAAIAGVAKESLIRMLGELKDEGLIRVDGAKIRILELKKLENMYSKFTIIR